jgi:hypothetical protein
MMKRFLSLMGFLLLFNVSQAMAQTEQCQTLLQTLITTALANPTLPDSGQGLPIIGTVLVNDEETSNAFTLAEVTSVSTSALDLDTETWGISALDINTGASTVNALLFGEASLTNLIDGLVAEVYLPIKNIADYDINLRGGAGTNFPTIGTMPFETETTTDGRSADNQWFRMNFEGVVVWVNASLVEVTGDISTLPIVDSPFTEPFQSFTLETINDSDSPCGVLTSGLLLQYNGEGLAVLSINDAQLRFSTLTALLQTQDDALLIQVLAGDVEVSANDELLQIEAGQALTVGDTNDIADSYTYANVAGTPLGLLGVQPNVCVAGLTFDSENISTRQGPGEEYIEGNPLEAQSHYAAEGYALDENNANWIKVGRSQWIQTDALALVGACAEYAELPKPALASEVQPQNVSLIPTQNTRYQAYSGNDVMTGTCTAMPLAVCDHLVVIIPNADGTIGWRGQEPTTYTLTNVGLNRYTFSGRNFLNNANLTLDLTFTSTSNWTMTMTTVFDSDPACSHNFYYSATRL